MFWLMGQMFLLPVQTFVFGMERMLEMMRGIQDASGRGMQVIAGGPAQQSSSQQIPAIQSDFDERVAARGIDIVSEEIKNMDKNLNDDMLKLVRFKVLFVKRDYEHAFNEEEALVADNMDGSAFTAWKIAEFIQRLGRGATEVPSNWKNYPDDTNVATRGERKYLTGFPEGDKKYLRVYYEVLERYSREKLQYQEDHLNELKAQTSYLGRIADAQERLSRPQ
jgi:hypothetical protein